MSLSVGHMRTVRLLGNEEPAKAAGKQAHVLFPMYASFLAGPACWFPSVVRRQAQRVGSLENYDNRSK